jgi:hypothetical protein
LSSIDKTLTVAIFIEIGGLLLRVLLPGVRRALHMIVL